MSAVSISTVCLVLGVAVGCATVPPEPIPVPPLPVVQAPLEPEPTPAPPLPAEERVALLSEPAWVEGPPLAVATKAAKLALMKPALSGFDRAMLVYPYRPYAAYWADVPLRGSLHIQLQPGEEIRLISGLRKSDWLVQEDRGRTAVEMSHVAVTPLDEHASGRMTLITSWGVYYLDLHTRETEGLYGLSWKHPPRPPR